MTATVPSTVYKDLASAKVPATVHKDLANSNPAPTSSVRLLDNMDRCKAHLIDECGLIEPVKFPRCSRENEPLRNVRAVAKRIIRLPAADFDESSV